MALPHEQPAAPPPSVGELAERLFAAYTVEGGQVRVAGCTLEDQPLVRIVVRRTDRGDPMPGVTEERYYDASGRPVAAAYVSRLGLAAIQPFPGKPPRVPPGVLESAAAEAVVHATSTLPAAEVQETAIVWCKYAAGKLRFTFPARVPIPMPPVNPAANGTAGPDSASGSEPLIAELHFADWATLLAPPPFVCPYTQRRSFHLAVTDDGRIAAGEEIGVCAQTGRRVLRRELATCAVSGRTVMPERALECPIRAETILRSIAATCVVCGQMVSPLAIEAGRCRACRTLRKASKDDPGLARVLGAFPRLDDWRWWRMAETRTSYVLVASGVLRRLLIVVDRESLTPSRVAVGHRLLSGWALLRPEQFAAELGPGDAAE